MSKSLYMIDQTNNRIVEVICAVKDDWVKVRDVINNDIYLQKRTLLKKGAIERKGTSNELLRKIKQCFR